MHVLAPRLERPPHDRQFVVERHQFEIGRGDLRHERHAHRAPILHRREVFGPAPAFGPAQVAPQVQLPAHGGLGSHFGVVAERLLVIIVRLAVGIDRSGENGQPAGLVDPVELPHPLDTRGGREHVLVGGERPFDQVAQRRIAVEPPPRDVGDGRRIGLVRGEGLRQVQLGRLAVPDRRTAAKEGRRKGGKVYRDSFHRFSLALRR